MDNVRTLVERAIAQSPFATLLGLVCEKVAPDTMVIRLPYRLDVTTLGDTVHGGAIAGLCDVAATGACWASESIVPGSRGTTIGLVLHYLAAGRGQDLTATARVVQRGSSICVAEVDVRGADGTAVARATATYKLSAPPKRVS
jgi:uncharacterized protein (TIGR00369 family)